MNPNANTLELGDDLEPETADGIGSITTIDMTDEELAAALERETTRQPFGFTT